MFAHFPGKKCCLQWPSSCLLASLRGERTAVEQMLESKNTSFAPDALCASRHLSPPHHTPRQKPPSPMVVAQGDKLKVVLLYFFVSMPILENKQAASTLYSLLIPVSFAFTSLIHGCENGASFFIPGGFSLLCSLFSSLSLCTERVVTEK